MREECGSSNTHPEEEEDFSIHLIHIRKMQLYHEESVIWLYLFQMGGDRRICPFLPVRHGIRSLQDCLSPFPYFVLSGTGILVGNLPPISLYIYILWFSLLMVVGIVWALLVEYADLYCYFPKFTPDLFFHFLLPPIILEAAYSLYNKAFFDNLQTILLYAVVVSTGSFSRV